MTKLAMSPPPLPPIDHLGSDHLGPHDHRGPRGHRRLGLGRLDRRASLSRARGTGRARRVDGALKTTQTTNSTQTTNLCVGTSGVDSSLRSSSAPTAVVFFKLRPKTSFDSRSGSN